MNTFGPPKLVLVRGEGATSGTTDGKEYVDLLGGIAVNALGHAHPALVEAVTAQLPTLGHISNFFATEPQVELAERLLALLGAGTGPGVLHQLRHRGQRGRLQADPAHRPHPRRRHRGRLPRPHHGRPRADRQGGLPRAVRAAARRRHLRPVRRRRRARRRRRRRDRGRRPRADPGRGRRRRPARRLPRRAPARSPREHGALLWLDEVQTGIGRTGAWFAHQRVAGVRRPTSSPSPRASAAASRSAPASASATPADLLEPGQPRHHVRRQPGRLRRRARRARHDRARRPARPRHASVGEQLRDGLAADPLVTEVARRGLLLGARARRRRVGRRSSPPRRRGRLHRQRHRRPTGSGSRRRWCSPTAEADAFAGRLAGHPRRRLDQDGARHDPALPRATTTSTPAEQAEVLDLAADAQGERRSTHKPLAGPADGRADLRQADPAHPGVLRRRHRRARRLPDVVDGGLAAIGERESVADIARVLGRQAPRSCGAPTARATRGRWPRTPACRSSTRSPTSSTPASCSPTC